MHTTGRTHGCQCEEAQHRLEPLQPNSSWRSPANAMLTKSNHNDNHHANGSDDDRVTDDNNNNNNAAGGGGVVVVVVVVTNKTTKRKQKAETDAIRSCVVRPTDTFIRRTARTGPYTGLFGWNGAKT